MCSLIRGRDLCRRTKWTWDKKLNKLLGKIQKKVIERQKRNGELSDATQNKV